MAVTAAQITVGTTEVSLALAGVAGLTVRVRNTGTNPIFLGPTGLATSDGYGLLTTEVLEVKLAPGDQLFGIAAAAGETAEVLRT